MRADKSVCMSDLDAPSLAIATSLSGLPVAFSRAGISHSYREYTATGTWLLVCGYVFIPHPVLMASNNEAEHSRDRVWCLGSVPRSSRTTQSVRSPVALAWLGGHEIKLHGDDEHVSQPSQPPQLSSPSKLLRPAIKAANTIAVTIWKVVNQ